MRRLDLQALALVIATLAIPALAPSNAWADTAEEEGAWTLAIGSRHQLVRDAAFDAFSADDVMSTFDFSVTRRVWTELSVGLALQGGSVAEPFVLDAYHLEYNHTALGLTMLYESTQLSRQLVGGDWLRPTLRVEGGVVFGRAGVTFDDPSGEVAAEHIQWKVAPRLHTGVGLRIVPFSNSRVPTRKDREEGRTPSGYTFAIDAEVGWSLLTRFDFDALEPDPDQDPPTRGGGSSSVDDDDPDIPRHPVDLGELIMEGAEFRLGVLMRF